MKYLGVDGCKAGWVSVCLEGDSSSIDMYSNFKSLWEQHHDAQLILVDIPIGLPGEEVKSRRADTLARRMLGKRSSCVFSPGVRKLFSCDSYREACEENRKVTGKMISKQYWNIIPKIKDVDSFLRTVPGSAKRVLESHPEIAFLLASDGEIVQSKKTEVGRNARLAVLELYISNFSLLYNNVMNRTLRKNVAADDILDAAMLAVVARESQGHLTPLPSPPERDDMGLQMAIWYHSFIGQREGL
jgi:predicted RNase H-like nuclease